jgi:hypothetical protein
VHALTPEDVPLRDPWTVAMTAHSGTSVRGVGLYRRSRGGWSWIGADRDSTGAWSGRTRRLGAFALFRDERAPRITIVSPRRPSPGGPYSRWALEAQIDEQGSGVDGERSQMIIDGRPVPTEWDPEARRLRWRPLRSPGRGAHTVQVRAVDTAGNAAEASRRFTVE